MASPSLALPGTLFVGEDERGRLVAHLGAAAGWMNPKGILGWSTEISVVARDALTEAIRRDSKIVMPDEQIPAAKMPLALQAAQKSPLVAISGKLTQRLIEAGVRVHTIGADKVTSSFYYIGEGGGEENVRVEGDLVAAVGMMLGERADNAAIERVLDGLADRLLRSLSRDRVAELSLELAAALPRAAADGSGLADIDLESFEKELAALVGASEKYSSWLREIATKVGDTNDRKVDIPLFGDARKVSQGPFELSLGDQAVSLVTHERWFVTGPLAEPTAPAAQPAPKPAAASPKPAPVAAAPAPKPTPVAASPAPPPAAKPLAAPLAPPRPAEPEPAPVTPAPAPAETPVLALDTTPTTPIVKPEPAPAEAKAEPEPPKQSGKTEPPKAEPPKAEAPKAEAPKAAAKATDEPKPSATPVHSREDAARLADTAKVPRQEKGVPWLWILVALAAAALAYRFLIRH